MSMINQEPRQLIDELKDQINSYDHHYYVLDEPLVPDVEYDRVFRQLQDLEKKYPDLTYHTLTTRESDTLHNKTYIQDYISSGDFEQKLGREMNSNDTHMFLCGNPSMIGIPKIKDGEKIWPKGAKGVIQIMEDRGFTMDYAKRIGNIHFEKYW